MHDNTVAISFVPMSQAGMVQSPSTYIFLLNPQNSALRALLSLSEERNPGCMACLRLHGWQVAKEGFDLAPSDSRDGTHNHYADYQCLQSLFRTTSLLQSASWAPESCREVGDSTCPQNMTLISPLPKGAMDVDSDIGRPLSSAELWIPTISLWIPAIFSLKPHFFP